MPGNSLWDRGELKMSHSLLAEIQLDEIFLEIRNKIRLLGFQLNRHTRLRLQIDLEISI